MKNLKSLSLITLLIVFICTTSCARKGYYPQKVRIKGGCDCGGFGYQNNNINAYEFKRIS
jgi:hypothetical protein